jgi:uncharacterized cupredoxin-like copper-binding protein
MPLVVRRSLLATIAAVAVLSAAALLTRSFAVVAPGAAAAAPAAQTMAGPTIQLVDIAFAPDGFAIPANTPTTVTLINAGAAAHNFNIDQLGVYSGDLWPGEATQVTIDAPAGMYQYACDIPGHKAVGMVGTLFVQ